MAFKDYLIIDTILQAAKNLQGTIFRIEKDFPREIAETRQRLLPTFKSEKAKHPSSRVTIAYLAKLILNWRVIADQFLDWHDLLRVSRVTGFESEESTDESDVYVETETSHGGRANGVRFRPVRPWQAQGGPMAPPGPQEMIYKADGDDSDSSSAEPSQPEGQGAHRKVYLSKSKNRYPKLTDRVAQKMKSKSNQDYPGRLLRSFLSFISLKETSARGRDIIA